MKTLFGHRRKNTAVEAMQNGTPVRIGAAPLFLPRRHDGIQLNARHTMCTGYQATAIPLLWHTETRDVRVGGIWFLADHPTHLWASGVIQAGSCSNTIIEAIVDGQDMWVRPHLSFNPDKDLRQGVVSHWSITAVSITDKRQYGFWPYPTDTPVQVLPDKNLAAHLY
jgi:hypothetical protein